MELTLKVQPRSDTGKGPARRARAAGQVPGVLYGRDLDPSPVSVPTKEMLRALSTEAGLNVLINLQVEGSSPSLTMLREVQRHPIRGDLLHVDFVKVDRDVKIQADVPVHIVGDSRGVKEGGVVEHHLWELKVESLPSDVPPGLEVDITRLGLGEHFRVENLTIPDGVEILNAEEEIIVSVVEPQVIEIEEVVAEGEEAVAAEGEAAPAGAPEAEAGETPE